MCFGRVVESGGKRGKKVKKGAIHALLWMVEKRERLKNQSIHRGSNLRSGLKGWREILFGRIAPIFNVA